jgi:hypothetical protein
LGALGQFFAIITREGDPRRRQHFSGFISQGGTLATESPHEANLRKLRSQAHDLFDPLWNQSHHREMRHICYRWLASQLGVPTARAHFSAMGVGELHRAIKVLRKANVGIVISWWLSKPPKPKMKKTPRAS